MSDGRVTVIDRRAEYYARAAEAIAADPLDFYTRAEKGRRILAANLARAPVALPAPAAPLPDNVLTLKWKKTA